MKDDDARRLRVNRVWLTEDGCDIEVFKPIVALDENARRLVWTAVGGRTAHYNASVQRSRCRTGERRSSGSPISCLMRSRNFSSRR